ncbi:MAG: hypothetical protein WBQ43_07650 [Terriglobales bacterium]|jgi:probable HAF family extracellular repeat protein
MKPITIITLFCALVLDSTFSSAQEPSTAQQQKPTQVRYAVKDLGTLKGGSFSQATFLNNGGLVTGISTVADGTQHALLWFEELKFDIGKPGLGGPNSGAFGANVWGQAVGQAEISASDPNNENFCAYGTGLRCLPFLWEFGVMTALPTLGGNNGTVGPLNNRGEVPGAAENSTMDPECPSTPAVNGTGPQVLDFEPVIWGPTLGQIRELHLLPGDSVGMAFWINDYGQAVGTTGSCANTLVPPFAIGPHAVLWDKDGSVHDVGNLGGTANPSLLGIGNVAFAINDQVHITGVSVLPGNTTVHAFLWTKKKLMQDLGTLPGDLNSAGLGMNDLGDIVGASIDGDVATGLPRAMLWHNGVMSDLNALAADSPLYLLTAFTINDRGEIVGFGVNSTGEVHAFLATPTGADANIEGFSPVTQGVTKPRALSGSVRRLLGRHL